MKIKSISFFFCFFIIILKSQQPSDFYISDAEGNQNPEIGCNYPFQAGNCVLLSAHYPKFKETTSYQISSRSYSPYIPYNQGTPINKDMDDVFTDAIDLPFTFCFFGTAFNKIVIGSNGMISFDVNQANQPNAPNFTEALPSANLPYYSIFGALHDMYFSTNDDSEIYYSVIGNAPYRKFVVNFYKGRISGCSGITSTSQIVLSEGSNNVEVFVENKDLPCSLSKFKNALIGINGFNGASGIAAPGRNTGIWSTQNEAWIFAPSGNDVTPQFVWYDANNVIIGNSKDLIVCPTKEEKYKVDIIFTTCLGATTTYTDDILIKFATDYPTVKEYTRLVCNINEQLKLADYKSFLTTNDFNLFDFVFTDLSTGLVVNENTNISINAKKTFKVKISNKTNPMCFKETTLIFDFFTDTLLTNVLEVCDMLNDNVENNYQLSLLNKQLVGINYLGSVAYFSTNQNAIDNVNEVTIDNIVNGKQYWVRLSLQSCANVYGPVTIKFNPTPSVITPLNFQINICDSNSDGLETFDWFAFLNGKVTTDVLVTDINAYFTLPEAMIGGAGLDYIKDGKYKIYARVEYAGGCFSIAEINMDVIFGIIELKDSSTYICFNGTDDITVNLDTITNGLLISPIDGSVTGPVYYDDFTAANLEDITHIIPANQLITDDGDFVAKIFYARYNKGTECHTILPLYIYLVHFVIKNDKFNVCDYDNDKKETINPSDYSPQILETQVAKLEYFKTPQEATDNVDGTEISLITLDTPSTILIARSDYFGCITIFPVEFNLINSPSIKKEVDIDFNTICDNNSDGVEIKDITVFESSVNINNEDVEFTYYFDANLTIPHPDPKKISIKDGTVVYAKVKYKNSGCYSISKITFKLGFHPTINLTKATLKLCDPELNFSEIFDLTKATPQLYDTTNNTIPLTDINITYYLTDTDANNATNAIASSYTSVAAIITVYARFESKITSCYSIVPIDLISYFPVKTNNSQITICDNNLDGFYDVNLLNYKDQMVQLPNPENVYTFYLNFNEIDVPGKEIANPENFILNPYTSRIWVKVVNIPGCGDVASIDFVNGNKLTLSQHNFVINNVCDIDNDGKETVNLSQFESLVNTGSYTFKYYPTLADLNNFKNEIITPSAYQYDFATTSSKIYVNVSSTGFCPDYFTIDISLNKTPITTIPDYYYCKNDTVGITIAPDFSGLDVVSYNWLLADGSTSTDQFISKIKTIGNYKVTLTTSKNCTYTAEFKVINIDTPEITELKGENNSYTIIATGIAGKKILYSKDLINWQESNIFNNLASGIYSFYVRYEGVDCHSDAKLGRIFEINNGFTPNSDGTNDVWRLEGLDVFDKSSTIKIFDRFGNLVYQQTSNTSFEWDGKFNTRNVSTGVYWYEINSGDGRIYKGWILLKNRN